MAYNCAVRASRAVGVGAEEAVLEGSHRSEKLAQVAQQLQHRAHDARGDGALARQRIDRYTSQVLGDVDDGSARYELPLMCSERLSSAPGV